MAHHNQKAFSKQHFKEKNIGWIINKENFFIGIINYNRDSVLAKNLHLFLSD